MWHGIDGPKIKNTLYLYNSVVSCKLLEKLKELLVLHPQVTELFLMECSFDDDTYNQELFLYILETNIDRFLKLSIKHDHMFSFYNPRFNSILTYSRTLTELNLEGCKIGSQRLETILPALHNNHTLTILRLSQNNIDHIGMKHVAKLLQENTTLQILDLSCNKFKHEESLKELIPALQINTSLLELNLILCKIKDIHTKDLSTIIDTNSSLECLELSSNNIGNLGMRDHIIPVLKKNPYLPILSLGGNLITSGIKHSLISIFNFNSNLTSFSFYNTYSMSVTTTRAISSLTERNAHNVIMRNRTLFSRCNSIIK